MISVDARIKRGLILYLKEMHGLDVVDAMINESEIEEAWGGCDTCGYGETGPHVTFTIGYKELGDLHYGYVEKDGTSVGFLPEFLPYIDRASEAV